MSKRYLINVIWNERKNCSYEERGLFYYISHVEGKKDNKTPIKIWSKGCMLNILRYKSKSNHNRKVKCRRKVGEKH